jgi:NAD(P)-dependent dehydrogenase (short-subunit alcohol dehydrogenase family)
MLTVLIERPHRLIYPSSGRHRDGGGSLRDIDWVQRRWDSSRAYSESKLNIAALAFSVARHWPEVLSNAVDPGWVPRKMGGAGAPDDLEIGTRPRLGWLPVTILPRQSAENIGLTASRRLRLRKCVIHGLRTSSYPRSLN